MLQENSWLIMLIIQDDGCLSQMILLIEKFDNVVVDFQAVCSSLDDLFDSDFLNFLDFMSTQQSGLVIWQ